MKHFYKEICANYKKVFFYLTSVLFINAAIYAHPINFVSGIQHFYDELTRFDLNVKLNILAYFVFIVNFFYYIRSRFILKNVNNINSIFLMLFLVFFTQILGTLNLRLNFPFSTYLGQFSFFYILNISAVILLITNVINEKNHYLIKIVNTFQFLILLTIVLIVFYKANPFIHGYGKYLVKFSFLPDPNTTLYANSNGLGRLTTIFCLISYNFLLHAKSNVVKVSLLIISTTFLILTLVTEGRLNFLLVHMGLILSTIFYKSNNKKYLLFLILIIISQIFYKINLDKKTNYGNIDTHLRDNVKYNLQRIYKNLNNTNPFSVFGRSGKTYIKEVKISPENKDLIDSIFKHSLKCTKKNGKCNFEKLINNNFKNLNNLEITKIKKILKNYEQFIWYNNNTYVAYEKGPFIKKTPPLLKKENFKIAEKHPLLKKANDYTNGRIYKWIVIVFRNKSTILGIGSQMDRLILYDKGLFGNNDAAGSLPYMYAAGGILGVFSLIAFKITIFFKYLINKKKINLLRSNLFSFLSIILIIIIFIRSIFENSYAVWGVDFLIVSFALMNLIFYQNNFEKK